MLDTKTIIVIIFMEQKMLCLVMLIKLIVFC